MTYPRPSVIDRLEKELRDYLQKEADHMFFFLCRDILCPTHECDLELTSDFYINCPGCYEEAMGHKPKEEEVL